MTGEGEAEACVSAADPRRDLCHQRVKTEAPWFAGARSLLEKGHTRAGGPGTSPWGAPKVPYSPQGTSPSPLVFPVVGDAGANAGHWTPASCSTSVIVLLGWTPSLDPRQA